MKYDKESVWPSLREKSMKSKKINEPRDQDSVWVDFAGGEVI